MRRGTEADVYEVFAGGAGQGDPIRWVGNVRAADPELAWQAAKEAFTRREDYGLLWIAQRAAMVFSGPEDRETLRSSARLSYRVPGFPGGHRRDRLKAAEHGA